MSDDYYPGRGRFTSETLFFSRKGVALPEMAMVAPFGHLAKYKAYKQL